MKKDSRRIPGVECTRRFNSINPAMSSASLDLRLVKRGWLAGEDILSPRFGPNAGESLRGTTSEEDAQREFLRMVDVSDNISARKTCFSSAGLGVLSLCICMVANELMKLER